MKSSPFKKTAILGISFLILLLLVIFFFNEGARKDRLSEKSDSMVFSERFLDSLDAITLSNSESTVDIVKENDSWSVSDFKSDFDTVDIFLRTLADLPRGEKVSANPSNWIQYGVDEASARSVMISGMNKDEVFYIGNPAGAGSIYVRYSGDAAVYKSSNALVPQLRFDVNSWRDKTIVPLDADQIVGVSARVGEDRWSFLLRDGEWVQVSDEGEVLIEDQADFNAYLTNVLAYKANGFEVDTSKFQEADNAFSLQTSDGKEFVLSIDNTEDQGVFAQISGMEDLFKLSSDMSVLLRPGFLEVNEPEEQ